MTGGRCAAVYFHQTSHEQRHIAEATETLSFGGGSGPLPFPACARALQPNPSEEGQPHSDDDSHNHHITPVLRPPHRRVQAALPPQEIPGRVADLKVVEDDAELHDPPDAQVARVAQQDGAHDGDGHEAAREVEEEHVVVRVAHRHGLGDVGVQDKVRGGEVRPYRGDADGGVDPGEEYAVEEGDAGLLEWRHVGDGRESGLLVQLAGVLDGEVRCGMKISWLVHALWTRPSSQQLAQSAGRGAPCMLLWLHMLCRIETRI